MTLALSAVHPASADDIGDSITEAQEAYAKGDLAGAKASLDYASQMIAQKNAESLALALPPALEGWQAEEGASQASGVAMFGGGIQADRTYVKGDATVVITVVGDSPMLAQWMPMLANPQMAGALGKMIKVGKQRAIQATDGEITMVVSGRFLVTVSGSASADDKLAYAEAIDVSKLEGL
jgi:hypothetical protein